jgi:3D (Asp-Asp-Asp) domain-containing protein
MNNFIRITAIIIIASVFIYALIECSNEKIVTDVTKELIIVTVVETEEVVIEKIEEIEWYYFEATAYSANDPAQGTNNVMASGNECYIGAIAVDPEVIPLGTKVEVKGMGEYVAEDTGSAIKGNIIDILFTDKASALEFGRRWVWLRILEEDV